MGFKQAPSLPYSKLGYVEDGDYASRAYETDEYIIWKGGNYFAKTDILQGAEFVIDTNLTAIPDGVLNGIMAKVSALNDNLAQFIKEKSFTGTTDGYNGVAVPDLTPSNSVILAAKRTDADGYLCIPHAHAASNYRIQIGSANVFPSISSGVSVSITCYYIEI